MLTASTLNVRIKVKKIASLKVSKLEHNTQEKKNHLASSVVASFTPTESTEKAYYFLTAVPKSLELNVGEYMTLSTY